jgi:hypothetical protein
MDETQSPLGVAAKLGKLARILQPKLGPEQSQAIEELDGLAVAQRWASI